MSEHAWIPEDPAARALDAALEGLFTPVRPNPALEDRMIHALRTRTVGRRLSLVGWLSIAAAALLLVGLTGAVANQVISQGGLSFPGQWAYESPPPAEESVATAGSARSPHAEDVDKMAEGWRQSTLESVTMMDGSVQAIAELKRHMQPADLYNVTVGNLSSDKKKSLEDVWNFKATASMDPKASKMLGGYGLGFAGGEGKGDKESEKRGEQKPPAPPQEQTAARKIIRTGEIEYEVASFDAAVAVVTRLVRDIKGGFVATVSSDKLANGKVRGAVTVRLPPESLDRLVLDLRVNLGKNGELKNQRIGSQDVTKQYTDLESELRAARAMEERLLQIIKQGKGEIKDLLAVEKELGNWRTRLEKIEGELRYYKNLIALSTLTITLYEKESLQNAAVQETNVLQIVSPDVPAGYRALRQAVANAKGHIHKAQLNEQDRRNISATLDFEIPRTAEDALRDTLVKVGDTYSRKVERAQDGANVIDSKARWQLTLINQAGIPPRETHLFAIEVSDVDQTAAVLTALVGERQGRTVEASVARERSGQVTGKLVYDVPLAKVQETIERVKASGVVRVEQATKRPEVPDSPLAIARLDITLSNKKLLVSNEEGFWANIQRGLSVSFTALSWSLMVVIVGLCFLLPWAVVIWGFVKLLARLRRKTIVANPQGQQG